MESQIEDADHESGHQPAIHFHQGREDRSAISSPSSLAVDSFADIVSAVAFNSSVIVSTLASSFCNESIHAFMAKASTR